jgi:GNAT superfamily N-acetyltransferase
MSLTIRDMEPRDIPAGCELMSQLSGYPTTPAEMQNRLDWVQTSAVDWLYVCEAEGRVRGLMGFRLRENFHNISRYGEVSALVVHVEARRLGVGRALMAFAEELAHQHGCIGTWLVSGFGRAEEAHRFYESLGYHTTGFRFVKRFEE